jgi:hypothetical protein
MFFSLLAPLVTVVLPYVLPSIDVNVVEYLHTFHEIGRT